LKLLQLAILVIFQKTAESAVSQSQLLSLT